MSIKACVCSVVLAAVLGSAGPAQAGRLAAPTNSPDDQCWRDVSTTNAPSARSGHVAVWTGTEMIVWGGWGGGSPSNTLNDGGRYNPATDRWTPRSRPPARLPPGIPPQQYGRARS